MSVTGRSDHCVALAEEVERPRATWQAKGTDLCADVYCTCGRQWHIDGDFISAVECPYCHARFELSLHIRLLPLSDPPCKWHEPKLGNAEDDHQVVRL